MSVDNNTPSKWKETLETVPFASAAVAVKVIAVPLMIAADAGEAAEVEAPMEPEEIEALEALENSDLAKAIESYKRWLLRSISLNPMRAIWALNALLAILLCSYPDPEKKM